MPGICEGDQLAAPVVGMGTAFDQAVGFELVDDQGGVGRVDAFWADRRRRIGRGSLAGVRLRGYLESPFSLRYRKRKELQRTSAQEGQSHAEAVSVRPD